MAVTFLELRERLTPWLSLLHKYYQGHLLNLDEPQWESLLEALGREPASGDPLIKDGLKLLVDAEPERRQDLKYEFNRLFIGPGALLAPPYESCYRDPDRTLMGEYTLSVRSFYRQAGLKISRQNVEPDDFLAFELEFLLWLLQEPTEDKQRLAGRFLAEHPLLWCADHAQAVKDNSRHPICLGLALILEGIMLALTPLSRTEPRF